MNQNSSTKINRAIQDFRSARQKATLKEIIARIKGESTELLSFEEVRLKLKAQISSKQILKEIPIKAIIGSVNRYQDFMRDFLPLQHIDVDRWSNIELANQGMVGLPPIEVYQIGEAYFVSDGNHRVSVAKQLGSTQIEAYVTEVQSRLPLSPDVRPEDLILKTEYTKFLEDTNLDKLRTDSDLSVSVPGQYEVIEEHIAVHRYFMGIEQQHDISTDDAVTDWYDKVYLPIVSIIRDKGLLIDFPDRTETDLYLWIAEHRAALEEELNIQVPVESAMDDLADQYSQTAGRVVTRLGTKIIKAIVPSVLESGPPVGEWRQSVLYTRRDENLFCEILVPINGRTDGWFALEQAFIIAQREQTNIHGLYVLPDKEENNFTINEIQNEFIIRCKTAGVEGDLRIKTGDIIENICELARWNDLVVVNLTFPPEPSAFARLFSGIRNLVQRCPRPILFTPQSCSPFTRVLLINDGTNYAQEALFITAYLAGKWEIPLYIVSIGEESLISDIQAVAYEYLVDLNIQAEYIQVNKNNSIDVVLNYIDDQKIDLIVTGGYYRSPIVEIFQGSDLDKIMRQIKIPIIISR